MGRSGRAIAFRSRWQVSMKLQRCSPSSSFRRWATAWACRDSVVACRRRPSGGTSPSSLAEGAVGGEPGELGFQVRQLGGGPLGEQRGERVEGPGVMEAAVAVPPAGTSQVQRPVHAAHHDIPGVPVPVSLPAVRAGRLGGQGDVDLLVDHRFLHGAQQAIGLVEAKTQRVGGEGAPLHAEHVTDNRRGLAVGFDDDGHGDLHAARSPGRRDRRGHG